MNTLVQSDSGIVTTTITSLQDASKAEDTHISDTQDRVDQLQTRLQAQMAAADAAIAQLEQQVTYFTGMFEAMKANNDLYK